MGFLIATNVHYNPTGAAPCQAALVTEDDPTDYSTVGLAAFSINPAGAVVTNHLAGRVHDSASAPDPGTWHYINECPFGAAGGE